MKIKASTTSLLLTLLAGGYAQSMQAAQPKFVVGIVVDQLRTDYLEQLRPYFGQNGFNRLMSQGVYMPDVDFRHTVADAPSAAAVIYTGAWPSTNGLATAETIVPGQGRTSATLADPSKTRLEYSPENLRVSTIADEFFINNGNLSKIYSISGDPQVAVVAAGHAGNAAIWLDESAGKWATSNYYGSLPPFIANKNRTSPLSTKITASVWRPLHQPAHYATGSAWNEGNFSYSFAGGNRDAFGRFKTSAPFNTEVTDLAIDVMKSMRDSRGGMLNVSYSLSPYPYDYDGDNRPELVDSYVRLDNEIARLLDSIDKEYGAGATLVFLSSSGYAKEPQIPDAEARIPTGEITLKQAESLLNSYLSASYGNGDYVALIKDGKLYLDSNEARKKGIDVKALRGEVKDFLLRMGGVSQAYTIDEVLHSDNRRLQDFAMGVDAKSSPDLFIFFTPGWTVTDDNSYPSRSEKVRLGTPATPAFIMGPGLMPQTITSTVEATALAPTISAEINIRAPNAAADKPITLNHY